MFITLNSISTGRPVIVNTAHLIGVVQDENDQVWIKTTVNEPAFQVEESIAKIEKLLGTANN